MTKILTNQIEKVQKFYTFHALRKCKRSKIAYLDRLKVFDLETLSLRRTLYDLTTVIRESVLTENDSREKR